MARGIARGAGKSVFGQVAGLRPGRSVFNLSYEKKLTCDMGMLVPVMCEEVVPGDKWIVGNEIVVRLGAMLAPILHEINVYVHYFFVPYRLLWTGDEVGPSWESFISGGPTGTDASTLPKWSVTANGMGSLWDYLGFPIGLTGSANFKPMQFPMNAYNFIYNEYYRDADIISKVSLTQENILYRAWEKDYFTSSRPWRQRGTPPALPFSGSAVWTTGNINTGAGDAAISIKNSSGADSHFYGVANAQGQANLAAALNVNTLTAATFGVSDLRLSFQVQKWMERNARGGVRYTEYLRGHFGVSPRDDRMQRPEFLGGSKAPVIVSEVLQTGVTTSGTPGTGVGLMLGHGLGVNKARVFSYQAEEFGLIMGILSVMPRSGYSQGINRQWLRTTRYDFYSPEFAHLSEQPVFQGELFLDNVDADNQTVFGYQGVYDEMRYKGNMAVGLFAKGQTLDYWHLSREFASAPTLNQTFLECKPGKRVFQDQAAGDHQFYINCANVVKAIRPMPFEPAPGLMDHF